MNVLSSALLLAATASAACAAVSAADAARLGQDLTPFGAEAKGNADGTIPTRLRPTSPASP